MKRVYLVIPLLLIAVVITSQISSPKAKEKSELISPPLPPEPPPPPPPPQPYNENLIEINEAPSMDQDINLEVPEVPVVRGTNVQPPPPPPAPPIPEYEEELQ